MSDRPDPSRPSPVGAPAPYVSGDYRLGDVRAGSCSIARAAADLEYSPSWSLERGIVEVVEWMRCLGIGALVSRARTR